MSGGRENSGLSLHEFVFVAFVRRQVISLACKML